LARRVRAKAVFYRDPSFPPISKRLGQPQNWGVTESEESPRLDREQLRDVTLNDEELMREILSALVNDTSRQMQLLATAIQDQDATRCMHLAHYSKGACANLGANAAAELLREIERRAASHDFGYCQEALSKLGEEVEALRSEAAAL